MKPMVMHYKILNIMRQIFGDYGFSMLSDIEQIAYIGNFRIDALNKTIKHQEFGTFIYSIPAVYNGNYAHEFVEMFRMDCYSFCRNQKISDYIGTLNKIENTVISSINNPIILIRESGNIRKSNSSEAASNFNIVCTMEELMELYDGVYDARPIVFHGEASIKLRFKSKITFDYAYATNSYILKKHRDGLIDVPVFSSLDEVLEFCVKHIND